MEYEIINIKSEVFLIHANIGGWLSPSLLKKFEYIPNPCIHLAP